MTLDDKALAKMDGARHLLEAPAPEVVGQLIAELRAARDENARLKAKLDAMKETLECSHCGGGAIESPNGIFHEDEGTACVECGMPGSVTVYDMEASWDSNQDNDDAFCTRSDCSDCAEKRDAIRALPIEPPKESTK